MFVVRHVREVFFPDENNSVGSPLLESLNEGPEIDKERGILHLDSKVQHDARTKFVMLLIEKANFYNNNSTKLTAFHTFGFNLGGKQVLREFYDLYVDLIKIMRPAFLPFVNEKLTKVLDGRRLIERLHLNGKQLFEYNL